MTPETARGLVFGALLIHGLGHLGAVGALLWRASGRIADSDRAGWLAPRSWLLPNMELSATTAAAYALWIVAALGFVGAALLFWFGARDLEAWRFVALGAALVSTVGMIAFAGTWPVFNTVAAAAVNIAVFVTQLWLRWPALQMSR